MPKKTGHYVKNSELREELIKSHELGELTPRALEMCIMIAERLSDKLQYVHPEEKEDCIAFAIMDIIRYWHNYDPSKSDNAFAYITSISKNGLAKGWRSLGRLNFPAAKMLSIERTNIFSI